MSDNYLDIHDFIDNEMIEKIDYIAEAFDSDFSSVLAFIIRNGVDAEYSRVMNCMMPKGGTVLPPHTPPTQDNILNNNNPEGIIYRLNNKLNISNPIVTGNSPLDKKKARKRRKSPTVPMPPKWIEDANRDTIQDKELIAYGEKHGYDWYATKEMFLNFVDHHVSRGSRFVKWRAAFQKWVRNNTVFYGKPAKKTGTVLQSYEKAKPLQELFND